ncbi:MAG: DUF983 domain-containing protein [Crocinitomicaceae bacterium]|nr:DUF983 domain-containing protein [Crocinitomicaceae bacterium]
MLSSLKGKRLYSILNNKCPVCHEGDFFITGKAYDLKNFGKNHTRCSHCGHKYEMETGFFYGAMYVSYALAVAFSVAIFVAIAVLFPASPYYVYIAAILTGIVVLMPITFRLSRLIWMNLFYHYQPEKSLQTK